MTTLRQCSNGPIVLQPVTRTVVQDTSTPRVLHQQDGATAVVDRQTSRTVEIVARGPKGEKGDPGATASVEDQIVDGVTDVAPSQNAVYDALAGHVAAADPHPVYATDEDVISTMAAHLAAGDPHVQYRKKVDVLDGGNF